MKPTVADLVRVFKSKGYALESKRANLVGIRAKGRTAGKFDDLFVSFKLGGGLWTAPFTTDPGLYYLRDRLLSSLGCAILVPGQYRNVYRIDKHRGAYPALCQRNGAVKVYRDRNRNSTLDLSSSSIQEGHFGINIHKDSSSGKSDIVLRASAGCQVFRYVRDFDQLMRESTVEARTNSLFTYTLLDEADF